MTQNVNQNAELEAIRASLTEASTEIPARLDELLAQVQAGQPVDPELLAQVKGLAGGLAGIVPNTPAPEQPESTPENPAPTDPQPVEPVETPEPAPVDPAAVPEKPIEQESEPVEPIQPQTSGGEMPGQVIGNPAVDPAVGTPAATSGVVGGFDANDASGRMPG